MAMDPKRHCEQMEKLDQDVYASNRSLFETLMYQIRDSIIANDMDAANRKMEVLLQNYNNLSNGCQGMVARLRRLENNVET